MDKKRGTDGQKTEALLHIIVNNTFCTNNGRIFTQRLKPKDKKKGIETPPLLL